MAISSRRPRRAGINIWPGFVDALSQLIMVIVFVLLIFTAGQFFLTDALSGRDAELQKLTAQINQLTDMLSLERSNSAALQVKITQLANQLQAMTAERDTLTARVKMLTAQNADAMQKLNDSVAALQQANQNLAAANDRNAALGTQLSQSNATVNDLNTQIENLKQELARIAAALDASEAKNKDQEIQIADLGRRLNQALASKVEELARYRSEFFGRLREVLGDRPDIRVVGDRFVFQSEVLFDPGSAALSPEAEQRLAPVADALKQIAGEIPPDLSWVLQVSGFTDKRPINTPQFPSNWELSTARALSVVRYFVAQGIPPDHLEAAGFGEFQPVANGDDEESFRKNRRIELKLTER